ncbi:protein KRI1 homolog [Ananas comosus]|uniref:Protein KRI1 homolog n=1 Tax=Ananas comosus TaxID=4615 RepID=A0A6P5GYP9_ANACO|nr:protein KRI1 homolog [Ananas comosus]
MAIDLFDACGPAGGDDEEDLSKIEIDEAYARRLEHNKKREALQRFEELKKQGRAASSSDNEDDEDDDDDDDDDDDGDDDLAVDPRFYETLARVKKNDPEILQDGAKIYSSSNDDDDEEDAAGDSKPKAAAAAKNKKTKDRQMYLKDVNAQHLIEEGPEFVEKRVSSNPKVYNKEQQEGLKAFLEAEKAAFGADDNDGDIIKEKGTPVGAVGGEGAHEVEEKLDEIFGKDDDLSENEKFLKEYLLNRMWVDKDKEQKPSFDDACGISEDEDELDKQDEYEAKYNFRHEEGAADRVLGYSRVVEGSVRKKTNSRKVQRKSKEERMALAEQERKEELKHLKNLKKKEIQERLEKIRAVAGIADDGACKLGADDLEEDFDPEEYDKKMKEVFDADYYEAEDTNPDFGSDDEAELEKPDFDKEDELLGLPKGWDVGGSGEGFAAARERFLQMKEGKETEEEVEGKRKRKRKISLKEKVELEKELEEYYKLDYEDTIGDLKTRFKYKPVPSNRYGLRPEELLMANDKDLNQYVSLKKLAPYRQNEWKVTYHQKLKKDLILQGGKSERNKNSNSGAQEGRKSSDLENGKRRTETTELNGEEQLSRRTRRRRRQAELKLPFSRLVAYGKIPAKPHKKH